MTDCKEKALFDIFLAANVFAKVSKKKKKKQKMQQGTLREFCIPWGRLCLG